jgi:murein DD-endopeptidase MepM/ murein hydrolase activator NlpD
MYSPRGVRETIHPIANGTVSNIYTDAAGALIVTVYHYLDGRQFTSQYVHLSSYAPGLHVGQDVTINDSLGQMGSTGYSTGVHLHIAVLDCALNERTDPNCYDLNAWGRYGKKRLSEGFYGLGVLVYVPHSWYNFNE